jgi:HPt (histidine-containing phosphotransfer) domain-containing protein
VSNAADLLQAEVPTLDEGTVGRLKLLMEDVGEEGEDLARDLLAVYERDVAVRLERLQRGIAEKDPAAAAEAMHALKGASATVGARRVTELCSWAELRLRAKEAPARLHETLRRETARALLELRQALEGSAHD